MMSLGMKIDLEAVKKLVQRADLDGMRFLCERERENFIRNCTAGIPEGPSKLVPMLSNTYNEQYTKENHVCDLLVCRK